MEGWRSRRYFAAAVPSLIFCWAPVYYNPLLSTRMVRMLTIVSEGLARAASTSLCVVVVVPMGVVASAGLVEGWEVPGGFSL